MPFTQEHAEVVAIGVLGLAFVKLLDDIMALQSEFKERAARVAAPYRRGIVAPRGVRVRLSPIAEEGREQSPTKGSIVLPGGGDVRLM